ncbi:MAG: FG-GAP-like repeat-containing protein [Pseudomonadota bacterium]
MSDVNEAPTDLTFTGNVDLTSTIAAGDVVATAQAVDIDSGESFSYSLTNDAGGQFAIDSATGEITTTGAIDTSTVSAHTLSVRVTDSAGNTYTEAVQIHFGTDGADTINAGAGSDVVYGFGVESQGPADAIMDKNPVGYWRLGEADGATVAVDQTGNNNGTHNSGVDMGFAGVNSNDPDTSADYDGDGDWTYISHDNAYSTNEGTVQLWFNADSTSGDRTLISKVGGGEEFNIRITDGTLYAKLGDEVTGVNVGTDSWNHVSFSWGPDGLELYLNGNLVGSESSGKDLVGNNGTIYIGRDGGGGKEFNGQIDEVVFFDQQLSDPEISDLYDNGLNGGGAPAGSDTLNGGSGHDWLYGGDAPGAQSSGSATYTPSGAVFSYATGSNLGDGAAGGSYHQADVNSSQVSNLIITLPTADNTLTAGDTIGFSFIDENGDTITVSNATVQQTAFATAGANETGILTAQGVDQNGNQVAILMKLNENDGSAPTPISAGQAFYDNDAGPDSLNGTDIELPTSVLDYSAPDGSVLNGGSGHDRLYGGDAPGGGAEIAFAEQTGSNNPFDGIDIGNEATPSLVDIDGDGDLDLFVGEASGTLNYFENTGTASNPNFVAATSPFGSIDLGNDSNPTFVDIDGDGDLDAFVGEGDGTVNYFENTGSSTNPVFGSPVNGAFGLPDITWDYAPTFVDIDNDGDMDLFVGESDGVINFFENVGTSTNASFASGVTTPFGLAGVTSDTEITFADLDKDGDLDAIIGDDNGRLYYQENTGTASNPIFAAAVADPFGLSDIGHESSPTFADMDGDGDLDLIVGLGNDDDDSSPGDGQITYFENTTAAPTGSTLNGGSGNDTLVSGNAADTLNGGSGTDTVDYSGSDSGVAVAFQDTDSWGIGTQYTNTSAGGLAGDALGDSYSSIEAFVGSAHDDYVYGGTTDMTYDLGGGNDIFDTVAASTARDTVDAGAGDDDIWTGGGDDTLTGGTGDDSLHGEGGNDVFVYAAGDGSDWVDGGAAGGWLDTIELQGMDGSVSVSGDTVTGQGWTMVLDTGSSIDGQSGESLDLSDDASGTISFDDGATMTFDNIEQVNW